MYITGVRGGSNVGSSGKVDKKKVAGGKFSAHMQGVENNDAAVNAATSLVGVNNLFMLQEVEGEEDRPSRAQMLERGEEMLDYLDRLRLGLLEGKLPLHMVQRLNALVKQWRGRAQDPKLESILDDIELRAAVELAKLGADRL